MSLPTTTGEPQQAVAVRADAPRSGGDLARDTTPRTAAEAEQWIARLEASIAADGGQIGDHGKGISAAENMLHRARKIKAADEVLVTLGKWVLDHKYGVAEVLLQLDRDPGGRPQKTRETVSQVLTSGYAAAVADLERAGHSRRRVQQWQEMPSGLPRDDYEAYAAEIMRKDNVPTEAVVVKEAKHRRKVAEQRARERARQAERAGGGAPPLIEPMACMEWLPVAPEADLLLTDPPYSTDVDDIHAFAHEWLPVALSCVKPTGRAYVCIGAYPDELLAYLSAPRADMHLADVLVWTYRNTIGPSSKVDYSLNWQAILHYRGPQAPPLRTESLTEKFAVIDMNAPDGRRGERWHTWQKPDELGERLVEHATEPGGVVIDPFAGTGTFLLAAARLGRRAHGADRDPDMVAIAKERGCE